MCQHRGYSHGSGNHGCRADYSPGVDGYWRVWVRTAPVSGSSSPGNCEWGVCRGQCLENAFEECPEPPPPPGSFGVNCESHGDEASCHATHALDPHTPEDLRNGYRVENVCEWHNGQCETVDFASMPCCTEGGNWCGEVHCPIADNNGDAPGGWQGSPNTQCGGCDMDHCCGTPTEPATTGCCWNWCICTGDHLDAFATCDCQSHQAEHHCIRNC